MMSGLLLGLVLSVCTCWFHNTVTSPTGLVSTAFGTRSYYYYYYYYCVCSVVIIECGDPLGSTNASHFGCHGFKPRTSRPTVMLPLQLVNAM
jgi:hypothetical protein